MVQVILGIKHKIDAAVFLISGIIKQLIEC